MKVPHQSLTTAAPGGERPVCGRLAPSPTGLLHLGNAWAFLLAWLSARSQQGRLILRMEDLDPQRSRPGFAAAIREDLEWLGLDWDAGPESDGACGPHAEGPAAAENPCGPGTGSPRPAAAGPYSQSRRGAVYASALRRLEAAGLTYPCFCSRKELRTLASAPHAGEHADAPPPDPCRDLAPALRAARLAEGRPAALRLRCPPGAVTFEDMVLGPQRLTPADYGGDFALRRSDGVVAYQLAAAVDDGLMGVSEVVRGRDLLTSTPRQLVLLRALNLPEPRYAHIPLLLDASGERLAKRHASLSLRSLRERGVRPERITGYLARLAGLNPEGHALWPAELVSRFSLACLPREDLRVMDEDSAALA